MEALNLNNAADRLQQVAARYGVVILDHKKHAITEELLPHILDALAEQAARDRFSRGGIVGDEEIQRMTSADHAARWLCTKAVEVRQ